MRISVATAFFLLVAYGLFLAYGPRPAHVSLQSQWQENRYVVEKYLRLPHSPSVVFVGSSLAKRLDFRKDEQCIYNMALSGDSALTGLSVVAKSDKVPRQVFVEINILSRGANDDLVAKASGILPRISAVFFTENMPINLLYSFLLKGKYTEVVNEAVLQAAFASQRPKPLAAGVLDRNLGELERLTRIVEGRGTDVIFFELPINPEFSHATLAQIRTAFKRTLPHSDLIDDQELARGLTIKTVDGFHLRFNEAAGVVANMQSHIKSACVE